ncbi:MAG: glycosyltransferase family 4 protein [Proteobacteria bacterium]|nr:glycosyltransferase family 4 protein [Pseudomonadota bacterium]
MTRLVYIGFNIEGIGGIPTYTRYQIKALKDLFESVFVYSVARDPLRIAEGYADRTLLYTTRTRVALDIVRDLVAERRHMDLIVFNHINLAPMGYLMKKLFGTKYVLNAYNIDILRPLSWLRRRTFAACDLTICECQYTVFQLPKFHRDIPRTGLLYDPVDTEFFRPIDKREAREHVARTFGLGKLDGKFILVTVSVLPKSANKGHRIVLEAMAEMRDPDLLYLIVGDGPDRPNVERLAREQGLDDQVIFTGRVDGEELPYLYSAVDVVALISRSADGIGEGVPLGLLEGAACARPLICGNEDGSPEAICGGRPNGYAINPGEPREFIECLQRLKNSPELLENMGRNSHRFITDVFEYSKFKENLGALLRSVL